MPFDIQIDQLRIELVHLEQIKKELEYQVEEARQNNTILIQEKINLINEVEKVKTTNHELKQTIDQQCMLIDKLKQAIHNKDQEIQDELSKNKLSENNVQFQLDSLKSQLSQTEKQLEESQKKEKLLTLEPISLSQTITQREQDIKELVQNLEKSADTIEKMSIQQQSLLHDIQIYDTLLTSSITTRGSLIESSWVFHLLASQYHTFRKQGKCVEDMLTSQRQNLDELLRVLEPSDNTSLSVSAFSSSTLEAYGQNIKDLSSLFYNIHQNTIDLSSQIDTSEFHISQSASDHLKFCSIRRIFRNWYSLSRFLPLKKASCQLFISILHQNTTNLLSYFFHRWIHFNQLQSKNCLEHQNNKISRLQHIIQSFNCQILCKCVNQIITRLQSFALQKWKMIVARERYILMRALSFWSKQKQISRKAYFLSWRILTQNRRASISSFFHILSRFLLRHAFSFWKHRISEKNMERARNIMLVLSSKHVDGTLQTHYFNRWTQYIHLIKTSINNHQLHWYSRHIHNYLNRWRLIVSKKIQISYSIYQHNNQIKNKLFFAWKKLYLLKQQIKSNFINRVLVLLKLNKQLSLRSAFFRWHACTAIYKKKCTTTLKKCFSKIYHAHSRKLFRLLVHSVSNYNNNYLWKIYFRNNNNHFIHNILLFWHSRWKSRKFYRNQCNRCVNIILLRKYSLILQKLKNNSRKFSYKISFLLDINNTRLRITIIKNWNLLTKIVILRKKKLNSCINSLYYHISLQIWKQINSSNAFLQSKHFQLTQLLNQNLSSLSILPDSINRVTLPRCRIIIIQQWSKLASLKKQQKLRLGKCVSILYKLHSLYFLHTFHHFSVVTRFKQIKYLSFMTTRTHYQKQLYFLAWSEYVKRHNCSIIIFSRLIRHFFLRSFWKKLLFFNNYRDSQMAEARIIFYSHIRYRYTLLFFKKWYQLVHNKKRRIHLLHQYINTLYNFKIEQALFKWKMIVARERYILMRALSFWSKQKQISRKAYFLSWRILTQNRRASISSFFHILSRFLLRHAFSFWKHRISEKNMERARNIMLVLSSKHVDGTLQTHYFNRWTQYIHLVKKHRLQLHRCVKFLFMKQAHKLLTYWRTSIGQNNLINKQTSYSIYQHNNQIKNKLFFAWKKLYLLKQQIKSNFINRVLVLLKLNKQLSLRSAFFRWHACTAIYKKKCTTTLKKCFSKIYHAHSRKLFRNFSQSIDNFNQLFKYNVSSKKYKYKVLRDHFFSWHSCLLNKKKMFTGAKLLLNFINKHFSKILIKWKHSIEIDKNKQISNVDSYKCVPVLMSRFPLSTNDITSSRSLYIIFTAWLKKTKFIKNRNDRLRLILDRILHDNLRITLFKWHHFIINYNYKLLLLESKLNNWEKQRHYYSKQKALNLWKNSQKIYETFQKIISVLQKKMLINFWFRWKVFFLNEIYNKEKLSFFLKNKLLNVSYRYFNYWYSLYYHKFQKKIVLKKVIHLIYTLQNFHFFIKLRNHIHFISIGKILTEKVTSLVQYREHNVTFRLQSQNRKILQKIFLSWLYLYRHYQKRSLLLSHCIDITYRKQCKLILVNWFKNTQLYTICKQFSSFLPFFFQPHFTPSLFKLFSLFIKDSSLLSTISYWCLQIHSRRALYVSFSYWYLRFNKRQQWKDFLSKHVNRLSRRQRQYVFHIILIDYRNSIQKSNIYRLKNIFNSWYSFTDIQQKRMKLLWKIIWNFQFKLFYRFLSNLKNYSQLQTVKKILSNKVVERMIYRESLFSLYIRFFPLKKYFKIWVNLYQLHLYRKNRLIRISHFISLNHKRLFLFHLFYKTQDKSLILWNKRQYIRHVISSSFSLWLTRLRFNQRRRSIIFKNIIFIYLKNLLYSWLIWKHQAHHLQSSIKYVSALSRRNIISKTFHDWQQHIQNKNSFERHRLTILGKNLQRLYSIYLYHSFCNFKLSDKYLQLYIKNLKEKLSNRLQIQKRKALRICWEFWHSLLLLKYSKATAIFKYNIILNKSSVRYFFQLWKRQNQTNNTRNRLIEQLFIYCENKCLVQRQLFWYVWQIANKFFISNEKLAEKHFDKLLLRRSYLLWLSLSVIKERRFVHLSKFIDLRYHHLLSHHFTYLKHSFQYSKFFSTHFFQLIEFKRQRRNLYGPFYSWFQLMKNKKIQKMNSFYTNISTFYKLKLRRAFKIWRANSQQITRLSQIVSLLFVNKIHYCFFNWKKYSQKQHNLEITTNAFQILNKHNPLHNCVLKSSFMAWRSLKNKDQIHSHKLSKCIDLMYRKYVHHFFNHWFITSKYINLLSLKLEIHLDCQRKRVFNIILNLWRSRLYYKKLKVNYLLRCTKIIEFHWKKSFLDFLKFLLVSSRYRDLYSTFINHHFSFNNLYLFFRKWLELSRLRKQRSNILNSFFEHHYINLSRYFLETLLSNLHNYNLTITIINRRVFIKFFNHWLGSFLTVQQRKTSLLSSLHLIYIHRCQQFFNNLLIHSHSSLHLSLFCHFKSHQILLSSSFSTWKNLTFTKVHRKSVLLNIINHQHDNIRRKILFFWRSVIIIHHGLVLRDALTKSMASHDTLIPFAQDAKKLSQHLNFVRQRVSGQRSWLSDLCFEHNQRGFLRVVFQSWYKINRRRVTLEKVINSLCRRNFRLFFNRWRYGIIYQRILNIKCMYESLVEHQCRYVILQNLLSSCFHHWYSMLIRKKKIKNCFRVLTTNMKKNAYYKLLKNKKNRNDQDIHLKNSINAASKVRIRSAFIKWRNISHKLQEQALVLRIVGQTQNSSLQHVIDRLQLARKMMTAAD